MRNSCIAWSLVLVALGLMFMAIFPAFKEDIATSKALLEKFPEAVRAALGLNLSTFFTFLGFYTYTFSYILLAGAIQGMNIGLSMVSKEDSAKTTDFLLTKPVSRTRVFVAKLFAGLTILAITISVFTLAIVVFSHAFGSGNYSMKTLLLLNLAFLMVQVCFMAIGVLVSQLLRRVKSVVSISLGVVFAFFAVSLLGSIVKDEKFQYFTPFKFFDLMEIVKQGAYQTTSLVLVAVVVGVGFIVSYMLYVNRDVRAVA